MNDHGYLERILKARVYDVVSETPLEPALRLSRRLGCNVLLKREDLHSVFSFKARGAYNKVASLSKAEADRGIVAASAGNHAQGVALAAHRLGLRSLILMPVTTPEIKVEAVRALGSEILLVGDTFDVAKAEAEYHLVPLQKPWRRLRPGPRRHSSSGRRAERAPSRPRARWLSVP